MIERPDPLDNPVGEGPEDTNALLDALREGRVVRCISHSELVTVYFQMSEPGRIHRVSFAGSPPAVRKHRIISPVECSARLAQRMGSGRGSVAVTDTEELDRRERDHQTAIAFRRLWRMEREVERGD